MLSPILDSSERSGGAHCDFSRRVKPIAALGQAVILCQSAGFCVIARGTAPIRYRWLKNGTPIRGATNDQLVLSRAQFRDAGIYSVEVSNAEGSVNSSGAELTVNLPEAGDVDGSFASGGGSLDRSFQEGLSGIYPQVNAIAVQSDGKVLAGGRFALVNGVGRTNLARLQANGALDSGFETVFSGANHDVHALVLQGDGNLLIASGSNRVTNKTDTTLGTVERRFYRVIVPP